MRGALENDKQAVFIGNPSTQPDSSAYSNMTHTGDQFTPNREDIFFMEGGQQVAEVHRAAAMRQQRVMHVQRGTRPQARNSRKTRFQRPPPGSRR